MDLSFSQSGRDVTLEGGDFKMVDNEVDLLSQRLFIRFKTFQRELFWNTSFGIDYINQVFGLARPKSTVDSLFQQEILDEPMVYSITEFQSTVNNYNYNCYFKVKLSQSNIVISYTVLQTEDGVDLITEDGRRLVGRIS